MERASVCPALTAPTRPSPSSSPAGMCQRCNRYHAVRALHPVMEAWLCQACAGWIDYLVARGVQLAVTWVVGRMRP